MLKKEFRRLKRRLKGSLFVCLFEECMRLTKGTNVGAHDGIGGAEHIYLKGYRGHLDL